MTLKADDITEFIQRCGKVVRFDEAKIVKIYFIDGSEFYDAKSLRFARNEDDDSSNKLEQALEDDEESNPKAQHEFSMGSEAQHNDTV